MYKQAPQENTNLLTNYFSRNLSNNEISWIIEDSAGSFSSLTKLKSFYLNKNDIKSINTNAFIGLESLETLDLRDNNITSIKSNSFEKLLNLKSLKLNTISIICDCNLQSFYFWILNSRISDTDAACGYPIWLRGKYLRELHPSNFTCSKFFFFSKNLKLFLTVISLYR